jgi:hypothetical protein
MGTMSLIRFAALPSVFLFLASVVAHADPLPLTAVHYFNDYQNPTNWGNWGSAIYWGGGASVRN